MAYSDYTQSKRFTVIASNQQCNGCYPHYDAYGTDLDDALGKLLKRLPWLKVYDAYEVDKDGRRVL